MPEYRIIPKPEWYEEKEGSIEVSLAAEGLRPAEFASDVYPIRLVTDQTLEPEAYVLTVSENGIEICASGDAGAFYGMVTWRMILMQVEKKDGRKVVHCLRISDSPRYSYRGVSLDESRHFFGVETVKKLLDQMAFLKLNTFHWHLSDDQGFRVESKLFPRLNSVGSRRACAGLRGCSLEHRGGEYFHYYTQEEIREIVAYAKALHIRVIPEIDLPGHTSAILAAYPEYACDLNGIPRMFATASESGIFDAILCAGSDAAMEFVDRLFSEICPLFEAEYFHIGGDEALEGHKIWAQCPRCRALQEEQGLHSRKELQGFYMTRVGKLLKKYGKKAIVWNDCINDSFSQDIACQYWIADNAGEVQRQSRMRDVILSLTEYFYFDYKYEKLPLEKVYSFDEEKIGFGGEDQRVIGLECENWTEFTDTPEALEFGLYPRIAAFAEVSWTRRGRREYRDFQERFAWYLSYLDSEGINYSRIADGSYRNTDSYVFHRGADGEEFLQNEKLKLQC